MRDRSRPAFGRGGATNKTFIGKRVHPPSRLLQRRSTRWNRPRCAARIITASARSTDCRPLQEAFGKVLTGSDNDDVRGMERAAESNADSSEMPSHLQGSFKVQVR